MSVQVTAQPRDFTELFKLERHAFAAKMRIARAVLGWSQSELGFRIGITQRAIHKLEQGETEPRRTTMRALEEIWREHCIEFEDLADGGFRVGIRAAVLEQPLTARARRRRSTRLNLGVTAVARQAS
jgi:transcriptional regulator with XRE-family HTH domain